MRGFLINLGLLKPGYIQVPVQARSHKKSGSGGVVPPSTSELQIEGGVDSLLIEGSTDVILLEA